MRGIERVKERHHIAHEHFQQFMNKAQRFGMPRTEEEKDIWFDRRFFYTLGFRTGKRIGKQEVRKTRAQERRHYGR